MDILIETKGEFTRGMTVAERRGRGNDNPNADVVVNINRETFVKDFLNIMSK